MSPKWRAPASAPRARPRAFSWSAALIEARYTQGIRHINTDDNGDEDRIKNRVFSVTVGVRLH